MKKILLLPILCTVLLSFSACEREEALDPRPVIVDGQYVRFDIKNQVLTSDHPETAIFGGTLTTPGDNVAKYELFVRRTNSFGVTSGNYVPLLTVQNFPSDLIITPQMIADALGISVTDLQSSDTYRFLGYSYSTSGVKSDYNSLSSTVKSQTGLKQGYKFMTSYLSDAVIAGYIDEDTGILKFDNYQL